MTDRARDTSTAAFAEICGVLASPRGMPRISRPGRGPRAATELPGFGRVGYLAVSGSELAIFNTTKIGMHPGPKGEPLTRVPLTELAGVKLDERRLVAFLELRFSDGAEWTLQIGRINRTAARELVAQLRPA